MKVFNNIGYGNLKNEAHKLDIYLPDMIEYPVFVYFHGGGLAAGSKEEAVFAGRLAENGIGVVSANYRMYPKAHFPDYIKDAAAAVAWVKNNINMYGKCTKIFVGGSSAGAYLSMMLCFDRKYLGFYGISPSDICGYIHDAGQPTVHFNVLAERGLDTRRVIVDEAAPLYFADENTADVPMLVLCAENDMENRYEQLCLLVSVMKHFGKKNISFKYMKGYRHCEYNAEPVFGEIIEEFIKNN